MNENLDLNFDLDRFSRHLALPHFSGAQQQRLANATVAIVGLGGLGSNVALQLAAAGVGRLLCIDFDVVEKSNLPRQIAYSNSQVGLEKTTALKQRIKAMQCRVGDEDYNQLSKSVVGGDTSVRAIQSRFSADNALQLLSDSNVVVDGLDSVQGKLQLNDAALALGVPLVHAGVVGYEGQVITVLPGKTVCLRCTFPNLKEDERTCANFGVYAPLCQQIAAVQTSEVLALLRHPNTPSPLSGCILSFRGRGYHSSRFTIPFPKEGCRHSKQSEHS